MIKYIKNYVKKHKSLKKLILLLLFLKHTNLKRETGLKKKYPKVLQLPITYKCNSRCKMCNIWRMDDSKEMNIDEFKKFISDPIFKKITAVGVNGGEPSLITNIDEFMLAALELPSIKHINIISNGFLGTVLLSKIKKVYPIAKQKGISFHISISLDGYGETHNRVRGLPRAFFLTSKTIEEIINNPNLYCDSFDMGCTVIRQNVHQLVELDTYTEQKKYKIKYRLGIDNKRIQSDQLREQYSVIYSPLRQAAKEFFHSQVKYKGSIYDFFKYFSIFYWLDSEKPKRLLGCSWKENGITMDSRGDLYYCAVASKKIGALRNSNGDSIFFDQSNIDYRGGIIDNNCDDCIHDYSGKPELKNVIFFIKKIIFNKVWLNMYRIKLLVM